MCGKMGDGQESSACFLTLNFSSAGIGLARQRMKRAMTISLG